MASLFEALGAPLPSGVRVAIGFTSRGAKGKATGECAVCGYTVRTARKWLETADAPCARSRSMGRCSTMR